MNVKRVVPLDEVRANDDYDDMANLASIFHHEVVEDDKGVWRWRKSQLVRHLLDNGPFFEGNAYGRMDKKHRGSVDLNQLWVDFQDGMFSVEELMKFYMDMGYSLCGFAEVFGQKEAMEWNLYGALQPNGDGDDYTQTLIEWVVANHAENVS